MRIDDDDYVACLCEGSSEVAVVNLLIGMDSLVFKRNQLMTGEVLPTKYYKNSQKFSEQYLTMDFEGRKLHIFVFQDRKAVTYKLRSPYSDKVAGLHYVVTAPEIEMLMIHSLGLYDRYKKAQHVKKPCEFLAEHLKIKTPQLKSKAYIDNFYRQHDLVEAARIHKRKAQSLNNALFLADIVR